MGWIDLDEDTPTLEDEEGRDWWISEIMEHGEDPDEWGLALMIRDDDSMILRMRFEDGTEEVYDLVIRRKMTVVKKEPEGQSN